MTKYYQDCDIVSFVVRVEDDGVAECWDYLKEKWESCSAAREVAWDIYNHRVISEESAKIIIIFSSSNLKLKEERKTKKKRKKKIKKKKRKKRKKKNLKKWILN